jgi:hypothetical protein
VGLLLDLAVVVLALAVTASLALLAYTLGVSAVRSVRQARIRVAAARGELAAAEERALQATAEARASLRRMTTATGGAPGDAPDA